MCFGCGGVQMSCGGVQMNSGGIFKREMAQWATSQVSGARGGVASMPMGATVPTGSGVPMGGAVPMGSAVPSSYGMTGGMGGATPMYGAPIVVDAIPVDPNEAPTASLIYGREMSQWNQSQVYSSNV